ncbi:hypothetical protein [Devosia sp. CAU 1758]
MTTTVTEHNRPTHVVWQVIGEEDNTFWNRIGAGWANKDGKGISIVLDAAPLHGRIVIREVSEQDSQNGDGKPAGGKKGGQK